MSGGSIECGSRAGWEKSGRVEVSFEWGSVSVKERSVHLLDRVIQKKRPREGLLPSGHVSPLYATCGDILGRSSHFLLGGHFSPIFAHVHATMWVRFFFLLFCLHLLFLSRFPFFDGGLIGDGTDSEKKKTVFSLGHQNARRDSVPNR